MITKKYFLWAFLFVFVNFLNAQETDLTTNSKIKVLHFGDQLENDTFYVGIDGHFVMSFANDSIIQARFFNVDRFDRYQKIRYRRSGDTIFLHNSSQTRMPFSLCNLEHIPDIERPYGDPIIVRFFSPIKTKESKRVQEHRLEYERIYYMDTVSYQIHIPAHVYCRHSDIIVVSHGNYFARLRKDIDTSYYPTYNYLTIDMSNRYSSCLYALFNEFPLVINGDSIIPIDNEKNYQCWIDNGFFFPIMVRGRDKPWEAKGIPYWRAGLAGIKYEF